jgi:hypothetical protein
MAQGDRDDLQPRRGGLPPSTSRGHGLLEPGGSPQERKALIPPLLVAKASSSAALLWRFTQTRRRGFAVGAALDAFLLGVTAGLYNSLD